MSDLGDPQIVVRGLFCWSIYFFGIVLPVLLPARAYGGRPTLLCNHLMV